MSPCDPIQEKIALGEPLAAAERTHMLDCSACAALAEQYSLLEASLERLSHEVPSGFAGRVMARVAAEPARPSLFEHPRLALCVAYAGGLVALANIARFLSCMLLANGGTP